MIRFFLKKVFTADKWNIGFVHQSPESLVLQKGLCANVEWIKEDTVEYAADPFVREVDGKLCIFYEELNFWDGKGRLNIIEKFDFQTKKRLSGIEPGNIHLSYPYIFKNNAVCYCIPETSASKEVALYMLDPVDATKFTKIRTLIRGEEFVDTSIVYYNDKYWLFSSISQRANELYIYHSDTLENEFVPHALNPIPVLSHESRGAGDLFVVNNVLYRPTQNPTNRYGGSIVINKVELLSENVYQHSFEFEIHPESPYDKGVHNISFANNLIVLDGKRTISSVIMPLKKMVKKLRSIR